MIAPNLLTLSEIAEKENVAVRQLDYVCRQRRIKPIRRVGITRMFSEHQIREMEIGLMNLRNYG